VIHYFFITLRSQAILTLDTMSMKSKGMKALSVGCAKQGEALTRRNSGPKSFQLGHLAFGWKN
jgi:hypothetical protein